jgi:adenine-specific DNA-methyltransferase
MSADEIRSLILSHVPNDGSAIGNGALISLLREQLPNLSDADYQAARDALVGEGVLAKGRGRGGSVYLAGVADDEEDDEDDDGFELTAPEAAKAKRKAASRKVTRRPGEPAQVLSYRHTDTRVNNPDVGVVSAANDPAQPKTIWTYDPHLDPALMFDSQRGKVETLIDDALASGNADTMRSALEELKRLQAPYLAWAGKAERTSFKVDTVSLHVHERVDPATILANAARRLKGEGGANAWKQADLFAAPFENLPLRQALDFYSHEKGWSNRLIAGDSLLVMNSLLKKESMAGQVQMIYIDPPYGIKYGSNFQPFTNKKEVKDGADADLTQEPEMIKAFRDTWELGIHSYLTYLRDRLLLAKELLHESGSVFVQIGDENVHRVRAILDEIYGEQNCLALIPFVKTTGLTSSGLASVSDFLVWYAKDAKHLKYRQLYRTKEAGGLGGDEYGAIQLQDGRRRSMSKSEKANVSSIPDKSRIFRLDNLVSQGFRQFTSVPFRFQNQEFDPGSTMNWKTTFAGLKRLSASGRTSARKVGQTLPGLFIRRAILGWRA